MSEMRAGALLEALAVPGVVVEWSEDRGFPPTGETAAPGFDEADLDDPTDLPPDEGDHGGLLDDEADG